MELVAKSYQNYPQVSEVFEENGKNYINIKISCDRCGGHGRSNHPSWLYHADDGVCFKCFGKGYEIKAVRVYTEKEYAALERASDRRKELIEQKRVAEIDNVNQTYKESCGFKDGFITAVLGNTYPIKDELKEAGAKFHNAFNWYFAGNSGDIFVQENDLEVLKINWEDVTETDPRGYIKLKCINDLKEWIKAATYEPSVSKYQGEIGDKIQKILKVTGVFDFSNRYGLTHIHTMEDKDRNVYVWSTTSKKLNPNEELNIQATIKDHKEYKGIEQTILTRCKVV